MKRSNDCDRCERKLSRVSNQAEKKEISVSHGTVKIPTDGDRQLDLNQQGRFAPYLPGNRLK